MLDSDASQLFVTQAIPGSHRFHILVPGKASVLA